MRLQDAAEGHEHKMGADHPVRSSSTTNVSDNRSPVDGYGRLKPWRAPQAHRCTLCTRVFRTAQALGGHKNIHRRERACADNVSRYNHIRPLATLSEVGRPLFGGGGHGMLMTRIPPASANSMARASMTYMDSCYVASRRLPSQPPALNFNASTHMVSANFAHVPAVITTLTEPAPRADCNGGDGKREVANPAHQPFQQTHTARSSNIVMQRSEKKPYHRAPGRHACRLSQLPVQNLQSKSRAAELGESSSGADAGEESLDLELRL